jgi:hypothetical protein
VSYTLETTRLTFAAEKAIPEKAYRSATIVIPFAKSRLIASLV